MFCQIKVIREVTDIFPKYRPKVGAVYDADYSPGRWKQETTTSAKAEFAVVDVLDKRIVLRSGEFEIVGGTESE